ncbi:outer membrane protein [Phreatobacter sp.]|uniref:outer membrane protein n=1 Tax=Phreatobacter sp. TaxID=1966341 RepID=UPI003F6E6DED
MTPKAILWAALVALAPVFATEAARSEPLGRPDWSGVYFGIAGGLGMSDGLASLGPYAGPLLTLDVSNGLFPGRIGYWRGGGVFGLSAGVNAQSGSFVAGIEADLALSDIRVTNAFSRVDPGPIFPGVNTNTSYQTNFGTTASMRIRAGYSLGNTLIYATAGLAAAQIRNRVTLAIPELSYSSPDWTGAGFRPGYVVGVGAEHRVTGNISVKFEVLYFDFQDRAILATDPGTFPGESFTYKFSNTLLMQRIGLNMRF